MALFNLTSGADVFPGNGVDTRGADEIHGLGGNDVISSGHGNDVVYGGLGADLVKAGNGDDKAFGDEGNDTLYGGAGKDELNGGADNDILWGQEGDDRLIGGDGNDIMYGGEGADTIIGGAGYDTASLRYATSGVFVNATAMGVGMPNMPPSESDNDTFESVEKFLLSDFDDVFYGDGATALGYGGNDQMTGFVGADVFYGGAGHDTLKGDAGDDKLFGEAGDDWIEAGEGADVVYGGAGTTWAWGGDGADRMFAEAGELHGGAGDDVLTAQGQGLMEAWGDAGNDRIYGSNQVGSQELLAGGDGEDVIYAGAGQADVWGGAHNDRLYTEGFGSLNGEDGDDLLQGGTDGSKQYFDGGSGVDTVSYRNATAGVSVNADAAQSGGAAYQDEFWGVEKFALSNHDDQYVGDGVADMFGAVEVRGYAGSDTLTGGVTFDTLFGGAGNDVLRGGDLDDSLYGGEGLDQLLGDDGQDLVDGGGAGFNQYDDLSGGAGADTFVFKVGYGGAQIMDFGWTQDTLDLSTFIAANATWSINDYGPFSEVIFSTGDRIILQGHDFFSADQIISGAMGVSNGGGIPGAEAPELRPDLEGHAQGTPISPFTFTGHEWLMIG